LCHHKKLCQVENVLQESLRFEVPRILLDEIVSFFGEHVQGMKVELILNSDEIGVPDWENRNSK
jgi:hypothetical protein